jgi:hypothetical protein
VVGKGAAGAEVPVHIVFGCSGKLPKEVVVNGEGVPDELAKQEHQHVPPQGGEPKIGPKIRGHKGGVIDN